VYVAEAEETVFFDAYCAAIIREVFFGEVLLLFFCKAQEILIQAANKTAIKHHNHLTFKHMQHIPTLSKQLFIYFWYKKLIFSC
jgi:hypothetical protein